MVFVFWWDGCGLSSLFECVNFSQSGVFMKTIFLSIFFVLSSSPILFAKDCTYTIDEEKSMVEGTGFKFTEKKGVKGRFLGVQLSQNKPQKAFEDLFKGLSVSVDLVTLDSGNSLRDKNMRETLFSGILGDSKAQVKVLQMNKKKIETEIKLNNKTQKVSFDYSMKDMVIVAKGQFDALKFALGDQIAALKKRCGSLHTGSDGKSVTWPTF
ncbi:MAG: YceI family protein, partial [Pseudomonadota bacterium]